MEGTTLLGSLNATRSRLGRFNHKHSCSGLGNLPDADAKAPCEVRGRGSWPSPMGLGRFCTTSEGRQLELCGKSVRGEDVENGVKVAPGEEPTLDPLTLPSHTPEGPGR